MKMTLKAIRINNGWTKQEMAEKLNISVDTLYNYEAGRTYPDVPVINRILETTGMRYDDIIFLPVDYAKSIKEKAIN